MKISNIQSLWYVPITYRDLDIDDIAYDIWRLDKLVCSAPRFDVAKLLMQMLNSNIHVHCRGRSTQTSLINLSIDSKSVVVRSICSRWLIKDLSFSSNFIKVKLTSQTPTLLLYTVCACHGTSVFDGHAFIVIQTSTLKNRYPRI